MAAALVDEDSLALMIATFSQFDAHRRIMSRLHGKGRDLTRKVDPTSAGEDRGPHSLSFATRIGAKLNYRPAEPRGAIFELSIPRERVEERALSGNRLVVRPSTIIGRY